MNFKYLASIVALALLCTACGSNEVPPDYCLKDYMKNVTFIVRQNTGRPYNGTDLVEKVVGELVFQTDSTYTSTVPFLGNGKYSIDDRVNCKNKIRITFKTSPLRLYETYNDNLTTYNGGNDRYMAGFSMVNVLDSRDSLMLGRKSQ